MKDTVSVAASLAFCRVGSKVGKGKWVGAIAIEKMLGKASEVAMRADGNGKEGHLSGL